MAGARLLHTRYMSAPPVLKLLHCPRTPPVCQLLSSAAENPAAQQSCPDKHRSTRPRGAGAPAGPERARPGPRMRRRRGGCASRPRCQNQVAAQQHSPLRGRRASGRPGAPVQRAPWKVLRLGRGAPRAPRRGPLLRAAELLEDCLAGQRERPAGLRRTGKPPHRRRGRELGGRDCRAPAQWTCWRRGSCQAQSALAQMQRSSRKHGCPSPGVAAQARGAPWRQPAAGRAAACPARSTARPPAGPSEETAASLWQRCARACATSKGSSVCVHPDDALIQTRQCASGAT